jgi:hypothetical protein
VLRISFVLKNLTASDGVEPANLGTKGEHATSRPPKQLCIHLYCRIFKSLTLLHENEVKDDFETLTSSQYLST